MVPWKTGKSRTMQAASTALTMKQKEIGSAQGQAITVELYHPNVWLDQCFRHDLHE
jgi:hypothetical protein